MEKELKKCLNCGQENLVTAKYCNNCGQLLEDNHDNIEKAQEEENQKEQWACPVCCELIDSDTEICPYCDEPTHFHVPSNDTPLATPVKEELKKGISVRKIIIGILCVLGALLIIGLLLPDENDDQYGDEIEAVQNNDLIDGSNFADEDETLNEPSDEEAEDNPLFLSGYIKYTDGDNDIPASMDFTLSILSPDEIVKGGFQYNGRNAEYENLLFWHDDDGLVIGQSVENENFYFKGRLVLGDNEGMAGYNTNAVHGIYSGKIISDGEVYADFIFYF